MRLVRSSVPGAVERDRALHLLTERAVLTRAVCNELLNSDLNSYNWRAHAALSFLLRWICKTMPTVVRTTPCAGDGIDQMAVPEGYDKILDEIRAGAEVAELLQALYTADTRHEADKDRARLRERLDRYWAAHNNAVSMTWL